MTMARKIVVQNRWMMPSDLRDVLEIERAQFPNPWTKEHFQDYLCQRDCIGMVAEYSNEILGFVVYLLGSDHLEIINLAVDPAFEREGVDSSILDHIKGKVGLSSRTAIQIRSCDTNLDQHLFLKRQDFYAVEVERDYYAKGMDAYLFRWEQG